MYLIPTAERELVTEAYNTRVSLPGDWHKPTHLPPPEVIDFHTKFAADVEALRRKHNRLIHGSSSTDRGILSHRSAGNPLTDEQIFAIQPVLSDLKLIIDDVLQAVQLPGYSIETGLNWAVNWLACRTLFNLLNIQIELYLAAGDYDAALELAALAFDFVSRHEQSFSVTHLIALGLADRTLSVLSSSLDKEVDPSVLQRVLDLLTKYRDVVFPGEVKHWFNDELLWLQYAAGFGYPVDLSPQTKDQILKQYIRVTQLGYYKWLAANLPANHPVIAIAEAQIDQVENSEKPKLGTKEYFYDPNAPAAVKMAVRIGTGIDPDVLVGVTHTYEKDSSINRALYVQARYDLFRLEVAERLALNDQETTISDYLSPIPVDPFTSNPFLYKPNGQGYYSVGPDRTDDHATVLYNPINSGALTGDIWVDASLSPP